MQRDGRVRAGPGGFARGVVGFTAVGVVAAFGRNRFVRRARKGRGHIFLDRNRLGGLGAEAARRGFVGRVGLERDILFAFALAAAVVGRVAIGLRRFAAGRL